MYLEIGAPAILPLGLVKLDQDGTEKICTLGLTVQHPPVNIFFQKDKRLSVTGARADLGHQLMRQFYAQQKKKARGVIEIESTIATLVGMGSDAINGLAMMQGLSWINDMPHERTDSAAFAEMLDFGPNQALEYWGCSLPRSAVLGVDVRR
ncbi:MAG: hypothetical protein AAF614_02730 [Chloroflexota bacterium]